MTMTYDLLPHCRHQGKNSGRFHVLNVKFRSVSSERRRNIHTYLHTDSSETIKPFSERRRAQKGDLRFFQISYSKF